MKERSQSSPGLVRALKPAPVPSLALFALHCFAIYLERDPISHKQNVPPLMQSAKHASDLESATCVNNLLIKLTVVTSAVAADSTERDLISHALFRTCFYRVFWKVPFETPLLCCFHEKIL